MEEEMTTNNSQILGTVRRADEVGYRGRSKMIWSACCTCGKERWVPLAKFGHECVSCSGRHTVVSAIKGNSKPRPEQSRRQRGENNPNWKGGVVRGGNGYRYLLLQTGHEFHVMANKFGYVMEHRLVMAQAIGRALTPSEQVHHLNGNRTDNRVENLELWRSSHPSGVRHDDYHCAGCRCQELGYE